MTADEHQPVLPAGIAQGSRPPGTWLYAIDPAVPPGDDVPPWAVVGSYRVGDDAQIEPEFTPNPDYRPSPRALGFPTPTNELEASLQDAVTGHADAETVRQALVDATVFVPGGPGLSGLPLVDDGAGVVVQAFTSERYLPDTGTWRYWTRMPVRELAPALHAHALVLNPGSELQVRLQAAELSEAPGVGQSATTGGALAGPQERS